MQTLVLWAGMALTSILFITALIQVIRAPEQKTASILYEKRSYKQRQWHTRLTTVYRWGFVMVAMTTWCGAMGYIGYTRIIAG